MPSEHRLHPSSILFALGGSLKAFALPALLLVLTSGRSSPAPGAGPAGWGPARWMNRWMPGDIEIANWQFWLLLFLIPATLAALARYLSFRLRYEGTELVIRSGIFFRNERHVPYARIQNLDAVRNVVHRLLGVTEVRVETGGGQTPEATISVLHETVFEEMRRRIFAGRAAMSEGEPAVAVIPEAATTDSPAVQSRTLLHLPLRELLLNGVLENRGMLIIGAGYGLLWEAGLFRGLWDRVANGWYGPGLVRDTVRRVAAGEPLPWGQIAVLIAGIAGLLVLVRVLSMIWSWLRLYEFRLTRVGEDLRTEYGLLTRVTATIPLRRVQTVTIREAPLQRLVRRQSVRVATAGSEGAPENGPKQPREWLAPIIRNSAVPALVREVLPGFEMDALDWQPLHGRAFRRAVKPALLLGSAITFPVFITLGWRALAVLPFVLAWMTLATWKQVQRMQWAITKDAVAFRSGWLWRNLTVAPVVKIQTVERMESPFDRRAMMARVRVDTAGGNERSHGVAIPYLARETAQALYERLSAQAAHTTFRW
jgi:putative membrane protein